MLTPYGALILFEFQSTSTLTRNNLLLIVAKFFNHFFSPPEKFTEPLQRQRKCSEL